ncbi:MAG: TMEM165/GDT1 family protein [Eubacteriales bacterium]
MGAFIGSLFFITMAEMGDKTQLVALAFATRYKVKDVIGGIFAATLLVHLFSVVVGQFLGEWIPFTYIQLLAGISFIGFGIWTLRGDELDGEHEKISRFGPFLTVAIAFFLAELGDKTQLATISLAAKYSSTLAAKYSSFIQVWVGSTFGMVIADGLAIVVGIVLGKKLPEKIIKWVSAVIFIGFGIVTLIRLWV